MEVEADRLRAVRERIARTRRRWRAVRALEGAAWLVGLGLAYLAAAFAADNLLDLPGGVRLAAGVAFLLLVASVLVLRVVFPLARRLSDERVAVHIGKAFPDLDDHLINSLQLAALPLRGLSAAFARGQIEETNAAVSGRRLEGAVAPRRLVRAAIAAAIAAAAFGAYSLAWSEGFRHALGRYARPLAATPALGAPEIRVAPGDARVAWGEPLQVTATCSRAVEVLEIRYRLDSSAEDARAPMEFRGDAFAFDFRSVRESFAYRVAAAGHESRSYRVTVFLLPRIEGIAAEVSFPAYTGLPQRQEPTSGDLLGLLRGSTVRLAATANKPIARAAFVREVKAGGDYAAKTERVEVRPEGDGATRLAVTIEADADLEYSFELEDRERLRGEPVRHRIRVQDDAEPVVQIASPGRDATCALAEPLRLRFGARDDWGVREVELLWGEKGTEPSRPVRKWEYAPGSKGVAESFAWDLAALKLEPGTTFAYMLAVTDGFPGRRVRSPVYAAKVVTAEEKAAERAAQVTDVIEALRKLIEVERGARRKLEEVLAETRTAAPADLKERLERLEEVQVAARSTTQTIASQIDAEEDATRPLRARLLKLAGNEMVDAVRALRDARGAPAPAAAIQSMEKASAVLERTIAELEWVLAELTRALAALSPQRPEEKGEAEEPPEVDAESLLRKLAEGLGEFIEEQQLVIVETEKLRRKPVDDFTSEDEKKLGDLVGKESQWAEFFRDTKDDLSRVPPGDFTAGKLADEVVEVYAEIEKAKVELTRRNFELAVPLEQSGVELAKEIVTNMEKWLPNTRDLTQWNLEDPPYDIDVPMANLPEELEDLIGDLIEDEEELAAEVDDLSSRWNDSIDKGVGWAVDDGPISNWSATGKTGNRLPNSNELSGRSGEGRTGRSHGQFVEKTAQGKGGRKTPLRVTPDAYEEGAVQDSSSQTGGGTGGGKLSGGTDEGLRGEQPPSVGQALERMAQRQLAIRDRAEKVRHRLELGALPDSGLNRAVFLMSQMSGHLRSGEVNDFSAKEKVAVDALEDVRRTVGEAVRVHREKLGALPRRIREELRAARREAVPEAYRDLVKEYYQSLSE
ncbi:MAG: hypothetical protein HY721_11985 [Planctomycetes bacterium]|nr:hypothetical protein [Planctomycetota bacterium]